MGIKILTLALLFTSITVSAQVPVDQLAKPPANAQPYTILSTAGRHGKAFIWTAPDGSQWSRESILLRGQVWEMDQSIKLGADGMPALAYGARCYSSGRRRRNVHHHGWHC
jgi:hypothetical protein